MALTVRLENLLKTKEGQFLFFLVAASAIYVLIPNYFFSLFVILTLMNFITQYRMAFFMAGNIWFWVFSDILPWSSIDLLFPIYPEHSWFMGILQRVLIVSFTIGLLAIALRFKPKRYPVAVYILLYLFCLYCLFDGPCTHPVVAYAAATILLFGKFFWFLCLAATEKGPDKNLKQILFFHPFWTDRPAPIPQGWKALQMFEAKTEDDFLACRIGALKILIRLICCYTILSSLYFFVYGFPTSIFKYISFLPHLKIPSASLMGFNYINHLNLHILDLWLVQISLTVEFLMYFIITYDTIVFVGRLAGYQLPTNTSNPFTASTFHEFLSRMMYYYNKLLVRTFFSPIYYKLGFIKNYNLRTFIAVSSSVLLFGSAYHFFSLPQQLVSLGFSHTAMKFAHVLPYFLTLSILAATSVVIERAANRKNIRTTPILRILLPMCCFAIYSLCITMIIGHYMKSEWVDHKTFLLSLFGL